MRRLLLFIILIGAIGTVNAQWHFSITSMNYNDNCSGNAPIVQAEVEVWARIDIAKDFASKTYSTKEECESMRSGATMNWSSGGCYIRTTTSPCTGGNIGGGGISSGTQGTSQFSSTAIGEPYFAPNETYTVSQTGRDLEIKLEALNKSFNDAVNGIKTGDQAFDDQYQRQIRQMFERKEDNPATDSNYYSALQKARRLNADNDNNLETTKYKESIQSHINDVVQNNKANDKSIVENVKKAIPSAIDNYKFGAKVVKEGHKQLAKVPGAKSEQLDDLYEGITAIDNTGKIIDMLEKTLIGDKEGTFKDFKQINLFDQTKDLLINTVNTFATKWGVNFKKGTEIVEYHQKTSNGLFERILNYNRSILDNNDSQAEQDRKEIEKHLKKSTNTPKP